MLFSVGAKVRLKHTGDKGEVTELLDHGMINVRVQSDGMEIPVFAEDVVLEEEYIATNIKHPVIVGKQTRSSKVPTPSKKIEYNGKSVGVQLAFDPDYDNEGNVHKYKVFLLNDTAYDYLFSLKLERSSTVPKSFNGKLEATSVYLLDEVLYDHLNDSPTFNIECWQITTAGTEGKQTQTIKVKAKQFFKKIAVAPLLNRPVHLYFLFDPANQVDDNREDLKSYTKNNVRINKQKEDADLVAHEEHDVYEYANFSHEIDLHIDSILDFPKKMNSAETMRLQLEHFDKYMEDAIRLGVPRIFVIHGLGKGRLRNEIASRLIQMPEVKSFKNEYHPNYGFGATEVIF